MTFESTTQATQNPWYQVTTDVRRESSHRPLACTAGTAVLVLGFIAAGWHGQAAGGAGGDAGAV